MRTLTSNYQVVVNNTTTSPGYLVEISFPAGIVHLSSIGTVVFNSETWVPGRLKVSGISQDTKVNSTGQLTIGVDPDDPNIMMGYALNETQGFTGRTIRIWTFDQLLLDSSNNLGINDGILIFTGIGDRVSITPMEIIVSISSANTNYLYAPRKYMNPANGFNFVQPKGLKIPWGTEIFVLE